MLSVSLPLQAKLFCDHYGQPSDPLQQRHARGDASLDYPAAKTQRRCQDRWTGVPSQRCKPFSSKVLLCTKISFEFLWVKKPRDLDGKCQIMFVKWSLMLKWLNTKNITNIKKSNIGQTNTFSLITLFSRCLVVSQAGSKRRWRQTLRAPPWSWRSAGLSWPIIRWITTRAQSVIPPRWELWYLTRSAPSFSPTNECTERQVKKEKRRER